MLTFGKYKGLTLEQLKTTDPDYLSWGAKNLRSDTWRKQFQDALDSMTEIDQAIALARHDGLGFDEALTHIRDMAAQKQEDDRYWETVNQRQAEIFEQWSKESGKPIAELRKIWAKYCSWDESELRGIPSTRFSSDWARELFIAYIGELNSVYG